MALAAVVFDFDGLILDTESLEYHSIDEIFREHGTALSFEYWQSVIGRIDHEHWTDTLARQLGRPVDREALVAERRERNREALHALPVLEGVLDLVDAGGKAGLPLAVASSSPRDWVVPHLDRIGLLGRFDAVCTGDEVPAAKPAPDVYLLAAQRLGVDPAQVVAIEDSPNGCRAAVDAGMAVVAVPSSMTRGLDFGHAHHVVESAAELDLAVLAALVPVG